MYTWFGCSDMIRQSSTPVLDLISSLLRDTPGLLVCVCVRKGSKGGVSHCYSPLTTRSGRVHQRNWHTDAEAHEVRHSEMREIGKMVWQTSNVNSQTHAWSGHDENLSHTEWGAVTVWLVKKWEGNSWMLSDKIKGECNERQLERLIGALSIRLFFWDKYS